MDNFQLYRTNVLLGGQLKWDLILDSNDGELIINDFHITPICKNVAYNKYIHENLLNYPHHENIRRYYNKISGSFYENNVEQLNTIWPIITEEKHLDTHVGDFEMGCRRAEYEVYKKQFEFLCPLWLEHLSPKDKLEFEIGAYYDDKHSLINKTIKFNQKDLCDYHNKFINYFNDYIEYTGINNGNDNIMSIHIDKNVAHLNGLNVNTGLMSTIDISYIIPDLTNRERPLLEFDNIIINRIKDHKFITPQLFNICFYFNPEDILPIHLMNMMIGKPITFKVFTKINGKILDVKDFYSNYEYISKDIIGGLNTDDSNGPNVMDYLEDNKFVGFIDKNKMIQNTIHWSLVGNNNYIFNIYDGFSGYRRLTDDIDDIVIHSHTYGNSADIRSKKHKQSLNNLGWCNYIILENSMDKNKIPETVFWNNIQRFIEHSSNISKNIFWVNNIKYGYTNNGIDDLKLLLILNKTGKSIQNVINGRLEAANYIELNEDKIGAFKYDNTIFIISDDIDQLTFLSLYNTLKNYCINLEVNQVNLNQWPEDNIYYLFNKIKTADGSNNPPAVHQNKSLYSIRDVGPNNSTTEIIYYKNDNKDNYVLRYFGKIKPTFIDQNSKRFNYLYYIDYMNEDEYKNSIYFNYINTKYKPLYPSIGYFAIKNIKLNYINPVSTYKGNLLDKYEYSWFNSSKSIILYNSLEFTFTTDKDIKDYIKDQLRIKYSISDDEQLEYVYKLYKQSNEYNYINERDINNYKYTIKLTLI